jgi:energy-coupling factor transporter ATP-binding protein EcfA2
VITLTDISYRYPGTTDGWSLENINLTIHGGEFVLICGSSGSGKSTLGYLFNGLIASLRDKGYTVLLVTHDLEFALAVSDRWVVLHEGRKVGDGKPEELMEDGELLRMGAIGIAAGWSFPVEEESVALP